MKRLVAMILCVAMLTGVFTLAFPVSAATYSGSCGADGDNVKWTLDTETGKLTISGTGDMKAYLGSNQNPWYSYKDSIKTVKIENGVTSIGNYAFYDCTSLTSIEIPARDKVASNKDRISARRKA